MRTQCTSKVVKCSDVMDAIINREERYEGGILYTHQGLPIEIVHC